MPFTADNFSQSLQKDQDKPTIPSGDSQRHILTQVADNEIGCS
jgi:hypothetical protein